MMKPVISDEQLHAFIDGQLGPEEQEMIFTALKQDEELNRRACQFRSLGEMMRHAYAEPPRPVHGETVQRKRYLGHGLAASLLLVTGALLGWFAHGLQTPGTRMETALPQASYEHQDLDAFQTVQLMSAQGTQQNVVLHITTNDPAKLAYALNEVDTLLASFQERNIPIQFEVVANGDGMELLRSDTSRYPQRTRELIHKYDNLAILACANTLSWLQNQGIDTALLPDIGMTKSGLERVVERLQEGWLYIKV